MNMSRPKRTAKPEKEIEIGFNLYNYEPKVKAGAVGGGKGRPSSLPPTLRASKVPVPPSSKLHSGNPRRSVLPAASSLRGSSKPPTPTRNASSRTPSSHAHPVAHPPPSKNGGIGPSIHTPQLQPPPGVAKRLSFQRKREGEEEDIFKLRSGPSTPVSKGNEELGNSSHEAEEDIFESLVEQAKEEVQKDEEGGTDEHVYQDPTTGLVCSPALIETTLNELMLVEPQLLATEVVTAAKMVSRALKLDRRSSHGQEPFKPLALLHTEKNADVRGVMLALAQAAQLPTVEEAADRLKQELELHQDKKKTPKALCLVQAAWVELQMDVLRRSLSPTPVEMGRCWSTLDAAVEAGHPGAMFFVGCCLRDGRGLEVDLGTGLSWIERAAECGYRLAMHEMGEMYEKGVERGELELDADWGTALEWYAKAAERNHVPSQLNLGKLLLTACMHSGSLENWSSGSEGVMSEEEKEAMMRKAMDWLDVAASSGNQEALRLRERL